MSEPARSAALSCSIQAGLTSIRSFYETFKVMYTQIQSMFVLWRGLYIMQFNSIASQELMRNDGIR